MCAIAVLRMADERARWELPEVQAMLGALIEMNIERQLDTPGLRKGILFAEVERRLRDQGFNKT